jgi:outer membrane biogenesis lipoprotein LolB
MTKLDPVWRFYTKNLSMKKKCSLVLVMASAITLLAGCSWSVGSSPKTSNVVPTTGQQLIDLQKARNAGAINDAEYQAQRAKLLGNR